MTYRIRCKGGYLKPKQHKWKCSINRDVKRNVPKEDNEMALFYFIKPIFPIDQIIWIMFMPIPFNMYHRTHTHTSPKTLE